MKKQTAANNEFLKAVKVSMNAKIYTATLKHYNKPNTENSNEAVMYLQQFFNTPITEQSFVRWAVAQWAEKKDKK